MLLLLRRLPTVASVLLLISTGACGPSPDPRSSPVPQRSRIEPVGNWQLIQSGVEADEPWHLWQTRSNVGGSCEALTFHANASVLPTRDDSSCGPLPDPGGDSAVEIRGFERDLDEHSFGYLFGVVANTGPDQQLFLDDKPLVVKAGTFVGFFPRRGMPKALSVRGATSFECLIVHDGLIVECT
jgi:hypothetical protein